MSNSSEEGHYNSVPMPSFNLQPDKQYDEFEQQKHQPHHQDRRPYQQQPYHPQQIDLMDHDENHNKMPMQMPFYNGQYYQQPNKHPQQYRQHPQYLYQNPVHNQQQWCHPSYQGVPVYPQQYFNIPPQPYQEPPTYQSTLNKEIPNKAFAVMSSPQVTSFQCNCKQSKCLKLYCQCFSSGWVCCQSCNCVDCKNRLDNPVDRQKAVEEALLRNSDAFQTILNSKQQPQYQQPTVSYLDMDYKPKEPRMPVKKGCNCQKSNCSKKYCECYRAGHKCGEECKCKQCRNHLSDADYQEIQAQQRHKSDNDIPVKQGKCIDINITHHNKYKRVKMDKTQKQQVQFELKIYNNQDNRSRSNS